MFDRLKQRKLLLLWGAVPVILFLELVSQWEVPRGVPTRRDWAAAAEAVAGEKGDRDLVVISPAWASQGRMYFKSLISDKDFGRFDTTTYRRIFEVSIGGARSEETEGLAPDYVMELGNLTVSRYSPGSRVRVVYDFLTHSSSADTSLRKPPRITLGIDHFFKPRRVIQIPLRPRRSTLTFDDVPFGGTLYGYGVIIVQDYRASNYDEGGPVALTIFVDDKKKKTVSVANFAPLEPFEIPLPRTGRGSVRFEVESDSAVNRALGLVADVRVDEGGER
jgi:hypothetical protein